MWVSLPLKPLSYLLWLKRGGGQVAKIPSFRCMLTQGAGTAPALSKGRGQETDVFLFPFKRQETVSRGLTVF